LLACAHERKVVEKLRGRKIMVDIVVATKP
jgi:hypothetical protein